MAYDWRKSTVPPWGTPGRVAPTGAGYEPPAVMVAEPGYPDPYAKVVYLPGQETEDPIITPTGVIPTAAAPVAFNGVAETLPGVETEEPVITNGVGALPGVEATPALFPLVAPVIGAAAWLSFGFLKRFAARWGMTALKALIGVAAFKEFMDMLGLGAPDDAMIKIRKNGKRRYSIGGNPRVGTLQKVSRHCQRLLKKHEKVIREFLPKKTTKYGIPPARALSAIERAAIKGT